MSEWEIPADVRQQMESKLANELPADPSQHLVACNAPWGERLNLYTFSILDAGPPNRKYTFMFHVVYSEDEKYLDIVECGFIAIGAKPE